MEKYRFLIREKLASYREWVEGRGSQRFALVLFICLVLGTFVIVATAYMPWFYGFEPGKAALRTITASQSVTVLDEQATNDLKDYVAGIVEPVYVADPQALAAATSSLESFFATADQLRLSIGSGMTQEQAVAQLKAAAPSTVSDTTLEFMLTANPSSYDLLLRQAVGSLKPVFAQQITSDSLGAARERLRQIVNALTLSPQISNAVYEVTAAFIRPNQVIDEEQTLARQQAARDEVAPVVVSVAKGQVVVKKGDLITSQDALVLSALGLTQTRSGWQIWLGIFLICLLEGIVLFRLLHRFNKSTGLANTMLLALVTLMLGFTVIARLLILHPLSPYFIPVAGLGMVVAIILNSRSAVIMVTVLSLNVGLLTDLHMRYSLVGLIVGAFAAYLVSRVVQRAAVLGAAGLVMVIAAFAGFSVELFRGSGVGDALRLSAWGFAHGALAWVLTTLLLLIMDLVFNLTTPLRLLELANPAHPLLKKLLQVAPGTYNHSILMGNLSEAAAEAIGADPLLARVGAYYHDIGKTIRPEYFVENQLYVDNPHDRLSPNLSKLAISAHVRDGEHLAKVHGLPGPVIDIIKQHHGTSLMAFFYHKAKEASREPIDEESYRYEEAKPRSKEAAIIMLADATEAAVRALQNPTRRKIQGVIQEVFKQRIGDGQLDESELTLADLHNIQESFDTSLRGLVGHRISYPEEQQERPRARQVVEEAAGAAQGVELPGGEMPAQPRLRVPPSAAALRTRKQAPPGNGPGSGSSPPSNG
ncbi:MAG: HDIG domain-containing protein [Actinobacteria bacterium]|nr:HDIG domain-containing protein [Actinomycetota bacterium]